MVILQRVELGLEGKEVDEKIRRETDTSSMERKFLELMKRKLKKKRTIVEAARQVGSPWGFVSIGRLRFPNSFLGWKTSNNSIETEPIQVTEKIRLEH